MSQAIPAITIQANVPYEFTVPESPAPAAALVVSNSTTASIQWSNGSTGGYIPSASTVSIKPINANTVVSFTGPQPGIIYITVWTINDGPIVLPQGSPTVINQLQNLGTVGVSEGLNIYGSGSLASGGGGSVVPVLGTSPNIQLWNIMIFPTTPIASPLGTGQFLFEGSFPTSSGPFDALTSQNTSSNRLSGIIFPNNGTTLVGVNYFTVDIYYNLLYSPHS